MTPREALDIIEEHYFCSNENCRFDAAYNRMTEVVREYERLSLIEQLRASISEERAKRERGAPA